MILSWSLLILLLAAAGVVWFWIDSLGVRERANQAAMAACTQLSLQFLDGTVAFSRLALVRGAGGRLTLRRTYVFDYTANSIDRRQGFVILLGSQVESVGFAGESPLQRPEGERPSAPPAAPREQLPVVGNVYDLESWRHREQRRARSDGRADNSGEANPGS